MEFGIMISENDNFFYVINLNNGEKVERLAYWFIRLNKAERDIAQKFVGMSCEEHRRLQRLANIRKSVPKTQTIVSTKWGQLAKSVSMLPEGGKVKMRPVMNQARMAMAEGNDRKALAIIKRATTQVINLHIRNNNR